MLGYRPDNMKFGDLPIGSYFTYSNCCHVYRVLDKDPDNIYTGREPGEEFTNSRYTDFTGYLLTPEESRVMRLEKGYKPFEDEEPFEQLARDYVPMFF